MGSLAKIVNGGKLLIIFAKSFILDLSKGYEYATGFWGTSSSLCVSMIFQEQIL